MAAKKKSENQKLQEKLGYEYKNVWAEKNDDEIKKAYYFSDSYKEFLNECKTERKFNKESIKLAESNGYVSIDTIIKENKKLKAGDRVYKNVRNKAVLLAYIGKREITEGLNIVGAHIDSPRLDLKQNPVYEAEEMGYMKTHYYGGIKKYQWVTMPLSIHGVIFLADGKQVDISIGEGENDPVFTVTDLLPHLARKQMAKKASEAIVGEDLNILIGSVPLKDKDIKEKVKLNLLKKLYNDYGIIEEDFISAELEVVPAFKAKDIGFDRSLVGAYGQDDRSSAYPAFMALLDINETPDRTAVCILSDKEEIGSVGNTGAESRMFEDFIAEICYGLTENYSDIILKRCMQNSAMLSADVNAAVDPHFDGVQDKKNASFIGKGVVIQKYTGVRGKAGGSDANAEFISKLRTLFNNNRIIYQAGELGKADEGGGGTIAMYVAKLGAEVIDCGPCILSMHSPYEVSSKIDIYETYRAYNIFYTDFK
jgi:aspartyl aminopeptidase